VARRRRCAPRAPRCAAHELAAFGIIARPRSCAARCCGGSPSASSCIAHVDRARVVGDLHGRLTTRRGRVAPHRLDSRSGSEPRNIGIVRDASAGSLAGATNCSCGWPCLYTLSKQIDVVHRAGLPHRECSSAGPASASTSASVLAVPAGRASSPLRLPGRSPPLDRGEGGYRRAVEPDLTRWA